MSDTIRILVADDHPVVRDGLVAILSTQQDLQVVAEAGSGQEVLTRASQTRPDVILLDLEMPEMDGVATLRRLREEDPEARVIIFTAFDSDERILAAVQAGAQGYLLKGAPREEVFNAIRVVYEGGSLLQPVVASKLLKQMTQGQETAANEFEPLTPREREV
ncbi:MAG: response regulator, partial [Chloroflexota bacterium]